MPKMKKPPSRVCMLHTHDMIRVDKRGDKYKRRGCKANHRHMPREEALTLIGQGCAEWIGVTQHAIRLTPHLEWHKVKGLAGKGNARLAAMQMLPGGEMRYPRMVVGGLVSPR